MISPLHPGITAAIGLLMTDLQYEYTRSVPIVLSTAALPDLARLDEAFLDLAAEGAAQLASDGVPEAGRTFERVLECRYVGQGFELRAAVPDGALRQESVQAIIRSFYGAHNETYGHVFEDQLVEAVTLRLIARGAAASLRLPDLAHGGRSDPAEAYLGVRDTVFDDGSRLPTPRYARDKLLAEDTVRGPAIITQHNSTTVLPLGYLARVLSHGDILIRREGASA